MLKAGVVYVLAVVGVVGIVSVVCGVYVVGVVAVVTVFSVVAVVERFSYDLEMKTPGQNRNNKRQQIERFDWFIERTQTRVAFGW